MRLIDADALIQKRNHAKAYAQDMYVIGQGYVMDAPTIDAVPVVRCKDCAHGRYDEDSEMYECGYVGLALYNEPNHYCSCGAKLEDEPC